MARRSRGPAACPRALASGSLAEAREASAAEPCSPRHCCSWSAGRAPPPSNRDICASPACPR
eukprot:2792293-Pyramimonas_sp.AAC.1